MDTEPAEYVAGQRLHPSRRGYAPCREGKYGMIKDVSLNRRQCSRIAAGFLFGSILALRI